MQVWFLKVGDAHHPRFGPGAVRRRRAHHAQVWPVSAQRRAGPLTDVVGCPPFSPPTVHLIFRRLRNIYVEACRARKLSKDQLETA